MLIPYEVDVPMERWPVANFALIGATVLISFVAWCGLLPLPLLLSMVQHGWSPVGLLGSMFLHADLLHLLGNMLFLWVFGNAVCAKVGNVRYLVTYVALGVAAGACHNLVSGEPVIGASGAINGIVGMFLVFYPRNDVSCLYWIAFFWGRFHVSSYWMVLLWVLFDLWGLAAGGGGIAYGAHVGGFAAGCAWAAALLLMHEVEMRDTEESLLHHVGLLNRASNSTGNFRSPPVLASRQALRTVRPPFPPVVGGASAPGQEAAPEKTAPWRRSEPLPAPIPLDDLPVPEPPPAEPLPPPAPWPAPSARLVQARAPRPTPAPQTGTLLVTCGCGKTLRVPAAHAGKTGKCPGCGAVMRIEAPTGPASP